MQKQDIQIINKLPDEAAAMQALTALINDYFGEGE